MVQGPTVNHRVSTEYAVWPTGPPVNQDYYQLEYSKSLEVTSQGKGLNLSLGEVTPFLHGGATQDVPTVTEFW